MADHHHTIQLHFVKEARQNLSQTLGSDFEKRVKQKETDISKLLEAHGCAVARVVDIDSAEWAFTVSVTFSSLEGLLKFLTGFDLSIGDRNDPARFPKSELILELQNILLETRTTRLQDRVLFVNSRETINSAQAIKYFSNDQRPVKLREDLPKDARQEDINWKLWVFAQRGNPHQVKECLDLRADVNFYGKQCNRNIGIQESNTALHQAIRSQSLDTCQVLLQHGLIDVNARIQTQQGEGNTPFIQALTTPGTRTDWKLCQLLIDHGADVHVNNDIALYHAVNMDNYEACKELIETHGIPVDTIFQHGQTALFSCKSQKVCNLLLHHNASINIEDQDGLTPLQCAVTMTYPHVPEVVESLIKAKSDVNKILPDGYTALFTAISAPGIMSRRSPDQPIYQELIELGADIHARDKDGNSVLHILAMKANMYSADEWFKMLQFFKDAGLRTDTVNKDGCTIGNLLIKALFSADNGQPRAYGSYLDGDLKLLSSLLSPNMLQTVDKNGDTLLHTAARFATPQICQLLIYHGAKVNAQNKNGDTPLHVASSKGSGSTTTFEFLLQAGADVLAVNTRFETPLHCAASRNEGYNQNQMSQLIAEGAFVNAKDTDYNTPLHIATRRGAGSHVTQLLQQGANPCEANKDGKTPLHFVAETSKEESGSMGNINYGGKLINGTLFDVILAVGSTDAKFINATDKDGNTPLHLAAKVKNEENCIKLMDAGADALLKNKAGHRPLDTFGDRKPKQLAKYLKKQQEERLLQEGQTKLDQVKIFLIGEPAAGKSTLKTTLTSSPQTVQDHHYIPTPGIDIGQYTIKDAGNFSIWDYAGHEEYHVTHSLFLGGDNAIFLVAYDLSRMMDEDQKKAEGYYKKLKHWLSFVKAGNHPTRSVKPIVLLVATHIDEVDQSEGSECAKTVLKELQDLFKASLNIEDYSIHVDCRDKDSNGIAALINALGTLGEQIKGERFVPSLCEVIKKHMMDWCEADYPVLSVDEFLKHVKEIYPASGDQVLGDIFETATEYLHEMGEIYVVRSGEVKQSVVVLSPQWLCHTVIGPAFAKEKFTTTLKNKLEDKEQYTKGDFKKLYPKFSNYEHLLEFLKQLELIYEVEDKRYVMPVKLKAKKDKLWQKDATMTQYYGRRIECQDETDIFSADVFPCLQVAMMKKYSGQREKPVISCNEIKISQTVEGYIELTSNMRAIQYYVRGRGAGEPQQARCYAMLKDIETMIDNELEDRSPGTQVTKKYLSSTEIKKHQDPDKVRSYTTDELIEAVQDDGIVHEQETHNTDEVASMVCKGYDMVFLKACGLDCGLEWGMTFEVQDQLEATLDKSNYTRNDYRSLAQAIGITDSQLARIKRESSSATKAILEEWRRRESPTVGDLLQILSTPGVVDNNDATKQLKDMLGLVGLNIEVCSLPGFTPTGLSPKVLACRAALRQASEFLLQNAEPRQLWDHINQCFPEATDARMEHNLTRVDKFTGMRDIISEVLQLKEPDWWKLLLKGAQAHLPKSYGQRPHNIDTLNNHYKNVISQRPSFFTSERLNVKERN